MFMVYRWECKGGHMWVIENQEWWLDVTIRIETIGDRNERWLTRLDKYYVDFYNVVM